MTPEPLAPWQWLAIDTVKVSVVFVVNILLFAQLTWVERRVLAFIQFRLGPNRVGPFGMLQPYADAIKLLFKEEFMPDGANRWLFWLAPLVSIFTAGMTLAVIPYGPPITMFGRSVPLQIADLNVGVLYIFAAGSLGVYGVVMAGWSANSKYSLLGGLRSSAQMFSYELSLGLSWVGVIMLAGSFRIQDIVLAQAGGFWRWNWIAPHGGPSQAVAFLVYLIAATAEANRTPFDLPEGESELVAGFHTEYSAMKFGVMQIAEYVNLITIAALCSHLFLGGWWAPLPALQSVAGLELGLPWFVLKWFGLIFFFMWLRGTLPRVRYDQLMHFGWKVLLPVAALNILATAGVIVGMGR